MHVCDHANLDKCHITTQKISMRKRLYLLQWRDCQNYHNYRRRDVVSLISVRPPLQVGFDGYFVTYHTGYLQTRFAYLYETL